jgi:hypothetical protein
MTEILNRRGARPSNKNEKIITKNILQILFAKEYRQKQDGI